MKNAYALKSQYIYLDYHYTAAAAAATAITIAIRSECMQCM